MTALRPWEALSKWPARHPAAASAVLVLLFTLGTVFAVRMPVDRMAPLADAVGRVDAALPGFDAATVETMVTQRLEVALAGLPGLRELESRTRAGRVQITLRFAGGARLERALEAVRARVLRAYLDLPAGMEVPDVRHGSREGAPAIVYAVTAAELSDDVARWARHILLDPLRELPEVGALALEGLLQQEILIQPDPRRLAALGLGLDDLVRSLRDDAQPGLPRSRNIVTIPSGVEAVAAHAISLPNGEPIALAELARVSVVPRAHAERPRQGEAPALRLTIQARSPQEAARVAERAQAHLAWLRANDVVPADVVIHVLHDEARATREWRREALTRAGVVIAVGLATLLVAVGLRLSVVGAIGFAVWLPVSIAALWALRFTFNTATAVGAVLACLPFVLLLALPASTPAVLAVLAVAGASWMAGLGFGIGTSGSAAFAVMLLLGVLVRWLISAWVRPEDRALRPRLARAFPPNRPAGWLLAAAMLVPLYLVVVSAAHSLSEANAEQGTLRLRLLGGDFKGAAHAAQSMLPALHAIGHLEAVTSSAGTEEAWRLHLDPERMAEAGIGPAEVGRAFAVATDGLVVGEVVNAEQQLPLRVRLPRGSAGESFERLLLRGERDKRPAVYLRQVGLVERIEEPRMRLRVNGKPAVEITARWRGEQAREALEAFCRELDVPSGYRAECVVLGSPS